MHVRRWLVPSSVILFAACPWGECYDSSEPVVDIPCEYTIMVFVDGSLTSGRVRITRTSNGISANHDVSGILSVQQPCEPYTVTLLAPTEGWWSTRTATLTGSSKSVSFDGYNPVTITGSITWSGQGVQGLTLTATSQSGPADTRSRQAVTAASGTYTFDGPMYGQITLRAPATAPGGPVCRVGRFECQSDIVGVSVFREPVHFEVRPPTPTTILGSVTVDGMPLGGVTVSFGGPRQLTATTDAQGNYRVTNLAQGSYTVSISGYGTGIYFTTTTRTVDAISQTDYRADFPGTRTPPNQPPVVTITAPSAGAIVAQGAPLTLTGSANDPEDGVLTGASLAWSSSRDGALGTGTSITTASLSAGTHTITLTATDSRGARGTASVSITVAPAGMIQGSVTLYGSTPLAGVTLQLTGNGVSRTTTSNANGSYTFAGLLPGTYTVTAIAPSGITFNSATASVTVSAGQTATANFDGHYSMD